MLREVDKRLVAVSFLEGDLIRRPSFACKSGRRSREKYPTRSLTFIIAYLPLEFGAEPKSRDPVSIRMSAELSPPKNLRGRGTSSDRQMPHAV